MCQQTAEDQSRQCSEGTQFGGDSGGAAKSASAFDRSASLSAPEGTTGYITHGAAGLFAVCLGATIPVKTPNRFVVRVGAKINK